MAAKTKAKASKVAEAKTAEAEVNETVVAQETQTVEEYVAEETLKEETYVEAETTSEPEGEITEGVCVDEIVEPHMEEPDTCDTMPKYNEDEVCDGDFETIQTDTPDVEEKSVPMDEPQTDVVGIIDMPVPGVELQTDTPDIEEKPVSENKQGNLGYGYVYMWNGMASD